MKCPCDNLFYDDPNNTAIVILPNCVGCHYSCATCNGATA